MFKTSNLARRVRVASALSLATLLSVGIWSPIQAAPDPNPPLRGQNNRRGDTLRGTVDRVYSARSFDLRATDGRTYRVNMRFSVGLEARSEVRVRGDLRGSNFDARTVTVGDFSDNRYDDGYNNDTNNGTNNGGYDNGYGDNNGQYQGQNVTLRGRITRVYSRTDVEVRDDDDGTIYRVRTNRALDNSIREGDRIEAQGELNGTNIRAESVVEIDGSFGNNGNTGNNNNNNDASFVSFSGPIESIDLNREEARVRAGNGYTYTISARRSQLDNFRAGQRVRVQGNWANQRVEVTQLTRE